MEPFLRDHVDDRAALEKEVAELAASFESLCAGNDQAGALRISGRLTERLRVLGDLERAQVFAQRHYVLCLATGSDDEKVRGMVRVATVRQYLGQHDAAEPLFREAVKLCDRLGVVGVKDLALQHFGKCLAEMGNLKEARECFRMALRMRQKKNDPSLVASTEAALAELDRRAGTAR